MSISHLDPSLAFTFYFQTEKEFESFWEISVQIQQNNEAPLWSAEFESPEFEDFEQNFHASPAVDDEGLTVDSFEEGIVFVDKK
jgi:hypothetical protein